jgi:glycosyltransferase involved in cell wall biosynthesis
MLLDRADAIIATSPFVQTFLRDRRAKTPIITPGVDTHRFSPSPAPKPGRRVLFVGDSRNPRKGLVHLLDAMKELPDLTLHVVGPSHPTAQARVVYTGPKTGEDLVAEFRAADVLVLPSTTEAESFGMVLVEAMACGVPVIGSRIGGIPTVIAHGDTGLLVPPANARALADAIDTLMVIDALREQFASAGRRAALAEYRWSDSAAVTDAVFRGLLT